MSRNVRMTERQRTLVLIMMNERRRYLSDRLLTLRRRFSDSILTSATELELSEVETLIADLSE